MRTVFMLSILSLVACNDDDGTDSGSDSGDTITIDCATDAWDITAEMAWKQAWMQTCMVPTMQPIFQGHDATRFAEFGCATCHGSDFNGGTFNMPNAFELNWAEAGTWPTDYWDATNFTGAMGTVVQTAQETLGYEPFDQATGEGFGCAGCHLGL